MRLPSANGLSGVKPFKKPPIRVDGGDVPWSILQIPTDQLRAWSQPDRSVRVVHPMEASAEQWCADARSRRASCSIQTLNTDSEGTASIRAFVHRSFHDFYDTERLLPSSTISWLCYHRLVCSLCCQWWSGPRRARAVLWLLACAIVRLFSSLSSDLQNHCLHRNFRVYGPTASVTPSGDVITTTKHTRRFIPEPINSKTRYQNPRLQIPLAPSKCCPSSRFCQS